MKFLKLQEENEKFTNFEINFGLLQYQPYLNKSQFQKNRSCCNYLIFLNLVYLFTIGFFIMGIIGTVLMNNAKNESPDDFEDSWSQEDVVMNYSVIQLIGFILFGITHFCGIIGSFFSPLFKSLHRLSSNGQSLNRYMDNVIRSRVKFTVSSVSSHTETRQESYYDSATNSYKTRTTTHTVITHTETVDVLVKEVTDLTMPLIIDHGYQGQRKFVEVTFEKRWIPSDERSMLCIKAIIDDLTTRNRCRDVNFSVSLNSTFVDTKFVDHGIFIINNSDEETLLGHATNESIQLPPLLNATSFILSTILLLQFPYIVYYRSLVVKSEITFLKSVNVAH